MYSLCLSWLHSNNFIFIGNKDAILSAGLKL